MKTTVVPIQQNYIPISVKCYYVKVNQIQQDTKQHNRDTVKTSSAK